MYGYQYGFYVSLAIYVIVIYFIGYLAAKKTKNVDDYVLGGRGLSAPITALAAGASDMSGWILFALPGAVYANGLPALFLPLGLLIGAFFNWTFIAKRLRIYTEIANNALTLPAFLKYRFSSHGSLLSIVMACAVLVFFTIYVASGFVAGALLLINFFHFSYHLALLISVVGIIGYLIFGGFLALSWIDFFQGSLMLLALIIVPSIFWLQTHHQFTFKPELLNVGLSFHHAGGWIFALSMLCWGLGYPGQPHILVRFMAIRNPKDTGLARNISISWMFVSLVGSVLVGLLGSLYFNHLAKPEQIILVISQQFLNPWLAGLLIAAILSAIMSTTSAQLLVTSSSLSGDIYQRLRPHAKETEMVLVNRVSVILVAALAGFIAYDPGHSLLDIVGYAWSGLGAAFGPVIILSLYWSRTNAMGAIAGVIVGSVTVILWHTLGETVGGIFRLYEIIPGFVLALIANISVSLLTKPQDIHQEFFEQLEQHSS
jgi:sodium/proline symporter